MSRLTRSYTPQVWQRWPIRPTLMARGHRNDPRAGDADAHSPDSRYGRHGARPHDHTRVHARGLYRVRRIDVWECSGQGWSLRLRLRAQQPFCLRRAEGGRLPSNRRDPCAEPRDGHIPAHDDADVKSGNVWSWSTYSFAPPLTNRAYYRPVNPVCQIRAKHVSRRGRRCAPLT